MENISVIGAGTMGNGITHVFAMNGYKVNLIDMSDEALDKAMATIEKNLDRMIEKGKIDENKRVTTLENISTYMDIEKGVHEVELVVEAATENVDIKLDIFRQMDAHAPKRAILATNTSSISITRIAAVTDRPEKVIGMHFMNPVPVMKLVEVIRGYRTSDATSRVVVNVSQGLGKVPVEVNDFPGFIANRILMPMINEAIFSLYQDVAGVEEIDTVMKLGMAHPMGPLQLADFIGLDVCHSIMKVLYDGFGEAKYAPCPLLVNMVLAGNLGRKTGEGFYDYSQGGKELVVADNFK